MMAVAWGAAAAAAGALGNGTSNDRAAIQACIDAAEAGQAILEAPGNYAIGTPLFMRRGTTLMGWGATLRPTSGFSGDFLVGVDPANHESTWKVEGLKLRAKDNGGTVHCNNGIWIKRHANENRYHFEFLDLEDFPVGGMVFDNESWALSAEQIRCTNCGTGILYQQGIGTSSFGGTTTQGLHNVSVINCTTGMRIWGVCGFILSNFYAEGCDLALDFHEFCAGPVLRGGHVKNCDLWLREQNHTGTRLNITGYVFDGNGTSGNLIDINTAPYVGFHNCEFRNLVNVPTLVRINSGGVAYFHEPNVDLRNFTTSCPSGTIAMVFQAGFYKRTNNGSWSGNLWT